MKLELNYTQKLAMNTQMQQSLKILQMNNLELEGYLNELAQENPLIEITPPQVSREYSIFTLGQGYQGRGNRESNAPRELVPAVQDYETLQDSLREQTAALRIPETLRREVRFLIGELDEQGYLPEVPADLERFGASRVRYENAVSVLQSLEPAGVGARNLSECLCIQLERRKVEDPVIYGICRNYLERLAHGQLNYIAKALGVSQQKVSEAKELISSLEPRPSNGFAHRDTIPYVFPDLEVSVDDHGLLTVGIAERYMPRYTLDAYYASLARQSDLPEETRTYFGEKLRQAKWVTGCITQRRDTLLACTRYIVETQADFFRDPQAVLQPLTMTQIADALGIHVSTVSRTVSGKYLHCAWGLFPLNGFIAQEVGTTGNASGNIRTLVKRLIDGEDPAAPLSDQAISDRLGEQGMKISRRTVAKYREEAMIPPASARRKR